MGKLGGKATRGGGRGKKNGGKAPQEVQEEGSQEQTGTHSHPPGGSTGEVLSNLRSPTAAPQKEIGRFNHNTSPEEMKEWEKKAQEMMELEATSTNKALEFDEVISKLDEIRPHPESAVKEPHVDFERPPDVDLTMEQHYSLLVSRLMFPDFTTPTLVFFFCIEFVVLLRTLERRECGQCTTARFSHVFHESVWRYTCQRYKRKRGKNIRRLLNELNHFSVVLL